MLEKCVIVVNEKEKTGVKANAASILAAALVKKRPDLVGDDVTRNGGQSLAGIMAIPVVILQADQEKLESLASHTSYVFTQTARCSRTYEEYRRKQAQEPGNIVGLLLIGPEKEIRSLTGDLPLMV